MDIIWIFGYPDLSIHIWASRSEYPDLGIRIWASKFGYSDLDIFFNLLPGFLPIFWLGTSSDWIITLFYKYDTIFYKLTLCFYQTYFVPLPLHFIDLCLDCVTTSTAWHVSSMIIYCIFNPAWARGRRPYSSNFKSCTQDHPGRPRWAHDSERKFCPTGVQL